VTLVPAARLPTAIAAVPVLAALVLAACARSAAPEDVVLRYGRALYANDLPAIYTLLSSEDRRVRDEATFRRQHAEHRGFTRDLLAQLASFITVTPVETKIDGRRATLTVSFRLPNANAPEIRTLAKDWDEDALNALPDVDRTKIRTRLAELGRTGQLPMLEGRETIELIRDDDRWRVFLNWAGGVHLHFRAAVDAGVLLQVSVTPADIVVAPGESVRVAVRTTNVGQSDVTTRVGHRIEPTQYASSLALLQCPLFIPIRFPPGKSDEFTSEYLLLKDVPPSVKDFTMTYRFPAESDGGLRSGDSVAPPVR